MINHPFYISDVGYKEQATSNITLSDDGTANSGITGSQSMSLIFSGLSEDDTVYYYCTAHSNMISTFNLVANTPQSDDSGTGLGDDNGTASSDRCFKKILCKNNYSRDSLFWLR